MSDNQLSREDLVDMSPDDILDALDAGRLNALVGAPVEPPAGSLDEDVLDGLDRVARGKAGQPDDRPISRADLAAMSPDEVAAAHDEGRLDHLLAPGEDA